MRIINDSVLRNLNTIGGLLLPLSFLFLVTFPGNMAQIANRHKLHLSEIFFCSFCIFGVMTNFILENFILDSVTLLSITPHI